MPSVDVRSKSNYSTGGQAAFEAWKRQQEEFNRQQEEKARLDHQYAPIDTSFRTSDQPFSPPQGTTFGQANQAIGSVYNRVVDWLRGQAEAYRNRFDPTAGISDTAARLDSRLARPDRAGLDALVDQLLADDPEYVALTRQISDLTDQMGRLDAGLGITNEAFAEADASLQGVDAQAAAQARQAGAAAAQMAGQEAEAGQEAIDESYEAALANMQRVLDQVDADTAASVGAAAAVEAWKDEALDAMEQSGADAADVARTAAEAAAAQIEADGAMDAAQREAERAKLEVGFLDSLRVAAQQRERAMEDRDRLRELVEKDAEAARMETGLQLNVPLDEREFAFETLTPEWVAENFKAVGLEAPTADDREALLAEFEALRSLASDKEAFSLQSSYDQMVSVFEKLNQQGVLSGVAPPPAGVYQFRNGHFRINEEALLQHLFDSTDHTDPYRTALKNIMAGNTDLVSDEMAELHEQKMETYRKVLKSDLIKQAEKEYRALENVRQRYVEAVEARRKAIESQKRLEPFNSLTAAVFYDAARNIGVDDAQARDLATSAHLHQLLATSNPSGRLRTKDNRGAGIFNLAPSTLRANAPHLEGEPYSWNVYQHAEAGLLYLVNRYGGDPRLALEHLAETGRW